MCSSKLKALKALTRKSINQQNCRGDGGRDAEVETQNAEKESPNIEEQYLCAIRTKSYEAIRSEVQNRPFDCSTRLLLEPKQDQALRSLLHSSTCRRRRRFRPILLDYLDFTLRARIFCCNLVHSIGLARTSHSILSEALLQLNEHSRYNRRRRLAELQSHFYKVSNLQSFSKLDNSLEVHSNGTSSMARRVMSAHREVARRVKLARHTAKAIHCMDCCGLASTLADNLVTAAHEREAVQLEAAARGAFALEMDLDTMGCMVRRMRGEIEHGRELIGLFVGDMEDDQVVLREVVTELQTTEERFMDRLVELEDHVYLCFLNINRTRMKVVKEILADDHQ